jgi:hypothetical protein
MTTIAAVVVAVAQDLRGDVVNDSEKCVLVPASTAKDDHLKHIWDLFCIDEPYRFSSCFAIFLENEGT